MFVLLCSISLEVMVEFGEEEVSYLYETKNPLKNSNRMIQNADMVDPDNFPRYILNSKDNENHIKDKIIPIFPAIESSVTCLRTCS